MDKNLINERPFPLWGNPHEIGKSNDGEDDFVIEYFNNKNNTEKKIVVDIGAADGITGSNSRILINNFNWSGILVEPLTDFYQFLLKLYDDNKNVSILNYACSIDETDTIIYFGDDQKIGLSSLLIEASISHDLNKKQLIKTKKFNNLIEPKRIDFLSLDTEGNDFKILKDIDYEKYDITVICCERWVGHDKDYNDLIINFLSEKGFVVGKITNSNLIFVKK